MASDNTSSYDIVPNPYVAPRTPQEQAYRQQQASVRWLQENTSQGYQEKIGINTNPNIPVPQMPTDVATRKGTPMARGLLDYFPLALQAVARCSQVANDQHNPGEEMHWARNKSTDHADCIIRHLIDRGTVDSDGIRHSTKVAWRALALLELELEGASK